MERSERIVAYLNDVCAQVRWKQAHPAIARELADHIEDERQGFLAQGLPEEAAENQAIKAMGDALEVGRRFDEAYRPQKNWSVWIPFAVLLVFGFFARGYLQGSFFHDYTPVLLIALFGACFIRAGWLPKWTWLFYGIFVTALLTATLGISVGGYNRLTGYILLFLPALSALLIYRMRGRGIPGILLICLAHTVIALFALQSSIGNYVLVALACMCLLLYAIYKGWFICNRMAGALIVVLPAVALILAVLLAQPYRFAQLLALVSPEASPEGAGFQGVVTRTILANANMVGPIDSSLLNGWVSGDILQSGTFANDFMLTVLAARLGKIVFVFAVLLLVAFVLLSLRICMKQRSMMGKFISLSVLLTFAAQGAGYIAGNLGVTLLLRYPMPFVAFGDTAMLCNLILCGLLFSTFRTGALLDDGVMQTQQRWKIKIMREL